MKTYKLLKMKKDNYNFRNCEWFVKATTQENGIRGFFVVFTVKEGILDHYFPAAVDIEFAFCPSEKIKEFESEKATLKECPKYIKVLKKNEIEFIKAVIPLNYLLED